MTDTISISGFQKQKEWFVQNPFHNADGPKEHMDAASQLSKFFAGNFVKISFSYGTSLGLILENFEK